MLTTVASQWIGSFLAFGADLNGITVVAGPDAGSAAGAMQEAGGPSPTVEVEGFVLLADGEVDPLPENLDGLAPGTVDGVVLRRAWVDRPGLGTAVQSGARALRSGGVMMVSDIDTDRLLGGSVVHYPLRLRFDNDPDAAGALRSTTVSPASLMLEATRAGLCRVTAIEFDEERGRFPSVEAYWQGILGGAWPSLAAMTPESRDALLEVLEGDLRAAAPLGSVVDREPWVAAAGIKP